MQLNYPHCIILWLALLPENKVLLGRVNLTGASHCECATVSVAVTSLQHDWQAVGKPRNKILEKKRFLS